MALFGRSESKPKNIEEATLTRLQITGPLSKSDVQWIQGHETVKVLQIAKPVDSKTFEHLNSILFTERHEIEFRVYGFYGLDCDLDFLKSLTELRNLAVDSLREAKNVEVACRLPKLNTFRLGIHKLDNFDHLGYLPDSLEHLSLGETKSKKPSLKVLEKFKQLKSLGLVGQPKDIESITKIKTVEKLTLISVTLNNLELLKAFPKLWSFELKLGGTRDIEALADVENLKYLEIWKVLKLSDLGVLSELKSLQFLFLQELRNVRKLPSLKNLRKLRRVHLDGMKGLNDLKPVADAPGLQSLIIISASNLESKDLRPFVGHPTLNNAWVKTGSKKKNEEIKKILNLNEELEYGADFVFE